MTRTRLGQLLSSLTITACGTGIVTIVICAMPQHMTLAQPHAYDWLATGAAGLMAVLVGGLGMCVAASR